MGACLTRPDDVRRARSTARDYSLWSRHGRPGQRHWVEEVRGVSLFAAILTLCVVLASCTTTRPHQIAFTPFYANLVQPVDRLSTEEVSACAETLFQLIHWGDNSLRAAEGNLGPTFGNRRLTYVTVDEEVTEAWIWTERCTKVVGHYVTVVVPDRP